MPSCIIKGCNNNSRFTRNISYFAVSDYRAAPELVNEWLKEAKDNVKKKFEKESGISLCSQSSGRVSLKDTFNRNLYRVCGNHFEKDCFIPNYESNRLHPLQKLSWRKLKYGSIPTIFPAVTGSEANAGSILNSANTANNEVLQCEILENVCFEDLGNATPVGLAKYATSCKTTESAKSLDSQHVCTYCGCSNSTEYYKPKVIMHSVSVQCENDFQLSNLASKPNVVVEAAETVEQNVSDIEKGNSHEKVQNDHTYASKKTKIISCKKSSTRKINSPVRMNISPITSKYHSTPKINYSFSTSMNESLNEPEVESSNISWYEPSSGEWQISNLTSESIDSKSESIGIVREKKYIVFESQLNLLLARVVCDHSGCSSPIDVSDAVKSENEGSLLTVKFLCINGHMNSWKSQPVLGRLPAGNLLIAASILVSGATHHRINSFMEYLGLKGIGKTTFYELQRQKLIPVILETWKREQEKIVLELKNKSEVNISADGRCDSPGHSAKVCLYTLMDQTTDKCVHFELTQKTEVDFKSTNMELLGLKKCLEEMEKQDITVNQLTTDRHIQIRAFLKKEKPQINHQFDVWHLAKAVRKKILALAKCHEDLQPWVKSLTRHLWYCSEYCEKDPEKLVDMWQSISYHVINKHNFPDLKNFQKCGHAKLTPDAARRRKWLKPNTPPHCALLRLVNDKKLIKDLKQINKFSHTSALECFHSLLNKYCPKQLDFDLEVMEARTILAIMDHNFNVERKMLFELPDSEINPKENFEYFFSKAISEWVARPLREPKSYDYVYDLLENIVSNELKGVTYTPQTRKRPRNIAPIPRPAKDVLKKEALKRRRLNL